jgi:hypothetical protein
MKKSKQKEWWKGKNTLTITATHWKTFMLGFKLGRVFGFKFLTISLSKKENK